MHPKYSMEVSILNIHCLSEVQIEFTMLYFYLLNLSTLYLEEFRML